MPRLIVPLLFCLALLAIFFPASSPAASAITISDIAVTTGASTATVSWRTNLSTGGAVFYGPEDRSWREPVSATGDGRAHTATIAGLDPATTYVFEIAAYRADGGNNFSAERRFTTGPGLDLVAPQASPPSRIPLAQGPVVSDVFNRTEGLGAWSFVNPRGDASYELTGTDLRIYVPDGPVHEPWNGGNNAVRLLQPAPNGDFDFIAKFNSRVSGHAALQGLIVQADDSNYVRFDISSTRRESGAERITLFAGLITNNTGQQLKSLNTDTSTPALPVLRTAQPFYMRIGRSGTTWRFSYSLDGSTYQPFHEATLDLAVTSAGVFAGNAQPTQNRYAQPFVASLDWFQNVAAPLDDDPAAIADTRAPLIYRPPHSVSGTGLQVSLFTDEPTTATLTYSSRTAPGGSVNTAISQSHNLNVAGLQPATNYSYTVAVADQAGNTSRTTGIFRTPAAASSSPTIDVWYGAEQSFGARGNPQRWVNILGKVSDANGFNTGVSTSDPAWPLRYSLNGGPPQPLRIGPGSYGDNLLNWRRIYNQGDFNVEIDRASLSPGANLVVISATDTLGNTSVQTVTVQYTAGQVWPIPYTIDWSQTSSVASVAQPVDGLWALEQDSVRPVELGYDRLLAIGDVSWTDFEVTVPITINQIDMYAGQRPNSGGPGVGMIMRWQGHYDAPPEQETQPRTVYYPMGGLGWYRLDRTTSDPNSERAFYLHIDTGVASVFARDPAYTKLLPGRQYIFKMRVQTGAGLAGGPLYSMKVWEACTAEPSSWTLMGTPSPSDQSLTQGSLLLVAHHVDASFGDVWVRPVNGTESLPSCDVQPPPPPPPPPPAEFKLWLPMVRAQ